MTINIQPSYKLCISSFTSKHLHEATSFGHSEIKRHSNANGDEHGDVLKCQNWFPKQAKPT